MERVGEVTGLAAVWLRRLLSSSKRACCLGGVKGWGCLYWIHKLNKLSGWQWDWLCTGKICVALSKRVCLRYMMFNIERACCKNGVDTWVFSLYYRNETIPCASARFLCWVWIRKICAGTFWLCSQLYGYVARCLTMKECAVYMIYSWKVGLLPFYTYHFPCVGFVQEQCVHALFLSIWFRRGVTPHGLVIVCLYARTHTHT